MKRAVFLMNLVAISSTVFGMFNNYQCFSQNKHYQYAELNENYENDRDRYRTWNDSNETIYDYGTEPNEFSEIDRLETELRKYKEQCDSLYEENQRLKEARNQNNVVQKAIINIKTVNKKRRNFLMR